MQAIDRIFVVKEQRLQILSLLNHYVRQQPPYLWHILHTSLIEHLLQCLLLDTSTTVISLALNCIIMVLPHIPSSARKHLPRLFLIYSRLLCWERCRPAAPKDEPGETDADEDDVDESDDEVESPSAAPVTEEVWDKLGASFDTAESGSPEIIHYFSFLYGLYPLNFMSYIRKPRRYLRKINFPRADDFDFDKRTIRGRSEVFTHLHLLHPGFTQTTIEDELDDDRWMKIDPADVVAELIRLSLYITQPGQSVDIHATPSVKATEVPPAYMKTEDIPSESLLGYSDENTDSHSDLISPTANGSTISLINEHIAISTTTLEHNHIEHANPVQRAMMHAQAASRSHSPAFSSPLARPVDHYTYSPTLGAAIPPFPPLSNATAAPSRSHRNGSIASLQNSTNTGTNTSPRMSPMAPTRDNQPRSPALRPASQTESNLSFLQREVTLLKNDLNFERYLKQQHLTHIGRLQRKHVREATVEAEYQNLINTNRVLKNRLAEANKAYAALKKETGTSRTQSKKYEAELTVRMRKLKEDERTQLASADSLQSTLTQARTENEALRQLIVDSEAKELQARQEVSSAMIKLEQLESLHKKLRELESRLRSYEARELDFERAADEKDRLAQQLSSAQLRLQSHDGDTNREREIQDTRIQDLEVKLVAMQNPTVGGLEGQLSPSAQRVIDQALSVVKTKYSNLKKEHHHLHHRMVDVELRNKDLDRELTDAKAFIAAMNLNPRSASGNSSAAAAMMLSSSPNRRWHGSATAAGNNLNSRTSSRRGNSIDEEPQPVMLTPTTSYSRHVPIPIPTASRYDALTVGAAPTSASASGSASIPGTSAGLAGIYSGTPPSSYRDRDYTSLYPTTSHTSSTSNNPTVTTDRERNTRGSLSRSYGTSPTSTFSSNNANPTTHPPMPPQPPIPTSRSNSNSNSVPTSTSASFPGFNPATPSSMLVGGGSPPAQSGSRTLHRTGTLTRFYNAASPLAAGPATRENSGGGMARPEYSRANSGKGV